ncbi:DUF2970 domain-containing protein [Pseudoalteromonas amylolytica]|uniref:DUF2970 domain-containing protein n=1 Tax=Pseudoalteromonas amylolytica TaxID=1859457 RepID=A0A1S1MSR1_9GAMM|nr:DUF2970 domain-containing protein [Pseudoalteromonas sp. MMG022]OHU86128.1 DUF2970 domain-containing protein [Pseudoalteromonas sp. JW3]OHU89765.1 DUF2970 domain-containing protein [Pseudoalteromonas amylolytica]
MNWLRVVQSVIAALFGVQSDKKYHEDFEKPKALPYLIVGIILVTTFVVALSIMVNYIVP